MTKVHSSSEGAPVQAKKPDPSDLDVQLTNESGAGPRDPTHDRGKQANYDSDDRGSHTIARR